MICLRLLVCLLIIILIASVRSRYVDNYLQDGVGLRRPGLRSDGVSRTTTKQTVTQTRHVLTDPLGTVAGSLGGLDNYGELNNNYYNPDRGGVPTGTDGYYNRNVRRGLGGVVTDDFNNVVVWIELNKFWNTSTFLCIFNLKYTSQKVVGIM